MLVRESDVEYIAPAQNVDFLKNEDVCLINLLRSKYEKHFMLSIVIILTVIIKNTGKCYIARKW